MILDKNFQYTLIDCGDGRRLEQFAQVIVDRPAPQATWPRKQPTEVWQTAHVYYDRPVQGQGQWHIRTTLPDPWLVKTGHCTLALRLSANNQLGIFPEQLINWRWLTQHIQRQQRPLRILNAFSYTGAATLAVAAASDATEICHLDGAKTSVSWARENAELSNLQDRSIRWIIDDVMTFLKRELNRGRRYDGFILDPPAFGRGAKGNWKIERDLPHLLDCVNQLLSEDPSFVILSCHVTGWHSTELARILEQLPAFKGQQAEAIDLCIPSQTGNALPLSICGRITAK